MKRSTIALIIGLTTSMTGTVMAFTSTDAADTTAQVAVTTGNYPTLETNRQMVVTQNNAGGVNKFQHRRKLAPTDEQTVVRLNRDTYYSFATVDISEGATVTLPDVKEGYYISSMVVTEDHRIQAMTYGGGERAIKAHAGNHVVVVVRLDSRYSEAEAKELQDAMFVTAKSSVEVHPINYDQASFEAVEMELKMQMPAIVKRDGIKVLDGMFTDPMDSSDKTFTQGKYEVGAAIGWGGAQAVDNTYEVSGNYPSDTCHQATFDDPKNKAFWSITVYDKAGFMFNDVAHVNSNAAVQNEDGTFTVSFGCGPDAPNNIETANDSGVFNLGIRHYQPSEAVRNGTIRVLPTIQAVTK